MGYSIKGFFARHAVNMRLADMKEKELRTAWVKMLPDSVARWYNMRLGPVHDISNAAMYSVVLKYADLIYVENETIWIVEFKVRRQSGALGQLIIYREEIKKTVEFSPWLDLPIRLRLVVPVEDIAVKEACNKLGIVYEVFPKIVYVV